MRLLFILGITLFTLLSCQQKNEDSAVDKDSPEALLSFIPKNYILKDTARGDLNQDGIKDLILVLSKIEEEETSDIIDNPVKRIMVLLLGKKNNTYEKAGQNENAIYCYDCGGMMGDPYQEIIIKDGLFNIEHFGGSSWRWARTSTFKYINNDWYLIEDALVNSHASEPENIETKIRTVKDLGEVKFEDFDIYKE